MNKKQCITCRYYEMYLHVKGRGICKYGLSPYACKTISEKNICDFYKHGTPLDKLTDRLNSKG